MSGKWGTSGLPYLCFRVLPMGWTSAVGVMQAVHRNLMRMEKPLGAGLPGSGEIRKTAVLPTSQDQRTKEGWQVYLDNYFSLEVHSAKSLKKALGQLSRWHQAARECWKAHNIPSARDKSVASHLEAKELGCLIDGLRGTLSTTIQRRLDAITVTLHLIGARQPHRMWLAVCAGQWNFVLQVR